MRRVRASSDRQVAVVDVTAAADTADGVTVASEEAATSPTGVARKHML